MTRTANLPTLFNLPRAEILGAEFDLRIVQRMTPEDHDAAGRANLARLMRDRNQTADLVGQRGNGHKLHLVREITRGAEIVYVYEQAI